MCWAAVGLQPPPISALGSSNPSFSAIDSCELEPFYSAPRHGTCWAAVGLRSPPISTTGSSK